MPIALSSLVAIYNGTDAAPASAAAAAAVGRAINTVCVSSLQRSLRRKL